MDARRLNLKVAQLTLGILVSAVAILLTLRRIDVAEARQAFHAADYRWLVLAAAFSVLSVLIRAVRWQALFHPHRAPFGRVFGVFTVGQLITTLLPFRLGDFARAYLIGGLERRSKVWALSTIVVERLLDIAVLVLFFTALLPFTPMPGWARNSVWIGGGAMLLLLGTLTVVSAQRARASALARRWTTRLPQRWLARFQTLASPAVDGLASLAAPRVLVRALVWSAVAWVAGGFVMWTTLIAFGLSHSFTTAMLLLVMSAVAVALPSSPGFVGVYHVVVIEALVFVADVSPSAAASYAVATHLLLFSPPVFIGVVYLWREPRIWNLLLIWRGERRELPEESRVIDAAGARVPAVAD